MNLPGTDTVFAGTIPQLYQRYLVPLIFEPYAADLAARVAQYQPSRVLEIAAGTGVVTRQLANTLPPQVSGCLVRRISSCRVAAGGRNAIAVRRWSV
jgi:predicted O-methyltransferase YrrM